MCLSRNAAKGEALPQASGLKFQTAQTFECGGEDRAHELLQDFVRRKIRGYDAHRDILAEDATSRLSRHLHLGTLCPRTVVAAVREAGRDQPHGRRRRGAGRTPDRTGTQRLPYGIGLA